MQRPTITPSPEESKFISLILEQTNSQQQGYLTVDTAVDVFNRSGLSRLDLRDIWSLSDADSNGRLTHDELAVAIRLIGWMQSGRPFSEALLDQPGPLPTFGGIRAPSPPRTLPQKDSRSVFPPIQVADMQESYRIFRDSGPPLDGRLEGDKVRDIFMRYNLAYRDLSSIWGLLDTTGAGRLNFHEFALGMYLIQALRGCHLKSVPTSVPPEVHEVIKELSKSIVVKTQSPFLAPEEMCSPPQLPARPPPIPPTKNPRVPAKPPPIKPKTASKPWIVMPREKAEYDRSFAEMDPDRTGLVAKDIVSGYLRRFRLPEEDLSQIMHVASIRNDTHLNADEFAVAMHLSHAKLKGKPVPSELSQALTPPSFRSPLNSPQLPSLPSDRRNSISRRLSTHLTASPTAEYLAPPNGTSPGPSSPSASSSGPSSSFLSENLSSLSSTPSKRSPTLPRHRSSYSIEEETGPDPLEELKSETKSLRKQIDSLLSQLTSQNDLRLQNDQLRTENNSLKSQVSELEVSIASVLAQMQSNDNALSEALSKDIDRLSRRVAELEQTESQLQQTAGILEVSKRDNAALSSQVRDLRNAETSHKSEIEDARHAMEELERENTELKDRLNDLLKVISTPPLPDPKESGSGKSSSKNKMKSSPSNNSTTNAKELQVLLGDITRENQALKERVRKTETSMETLLLSSRDTTANEELRRQNREYHLQIQELEQLTAQLQKESNAKNVEHERRQMEQVLLVVTRENEGMKVRIREMQAANTQIREQSDGRVADLQRRLEDLEGENTRLKREAQHRPSMLEADVPPPAYDDSYIS